MIARDKRKEFGLWLRDIRKRRGFSLVGAARRMGFGTKGTLVSVECGLATIPLEKLHPLADVYEVDLQELLEKLRECEPDLHARFISLQNNFFQDFAKKISMMSAGGRSSLVPSRGPDGEQIARHHSDGAASGSVYYVNYDSDSNQQIFQDILQTFQKYIESFTTEKPVPSQVQLSFELRPPAKKHDNVIPFAPPAERSVSDEARRQVA